MLKEQGSEARGREIKSRRERELEELRSRGVAKSRREKLKHCKILLLLTVHYVYCDTAYDNPNPNTFSKSFSSFGPTTDSIRIKAICV